MTADDRCVAEDLPIFNETDRNSLFFLRDRFHAPAGAVANASLRTDGQDRDFYEFTGVPAGVGFKVEIVDDGLDTVLGRYDAQGDLIDVDDDSGIGALSRLTGLVPESGSLVFAVSGFPDFGFEPGFVHDQSGSYQLVFRPQGQAVHVTETDRNSRFQYREVV